MNKSFIKNRKTLFLVLALGLTALFIISMLAMPLTSTSYSGAIYENTANYISVGISAFDGKSSTALTKNDSGNVTIQRGSDTNWLAYESYKWQDTKYLKISLSDIANIPEAEEYSFSYNVDYSPLEIVSNTLDVLTYSQQSIKLYGSTVASKSDIAQNFYFFLDDYANDESIKQATMIPFANGQEALSNKDLGYDYALQGGWGTYIFSFECQGKVTYSNIIEITPSKLSEIKNKTLNVGVKPYRGGDQSNNGAYEFYVNDEYAFINGSKIKWYLNGTGSDGVKYVLTPNDKTPAGGESSLFDTEQVSRTGVRFILDTDIQGKWIATAVIDDGTTPNPVADESTEVSTIKPFSTTVIIWIVTAITVIAVVIVAVVISITIKKEKTW